MDEYSDQSKELALDLGIKAIRKQREYGMSLEDVQAQESTYPGLWAAMREHRPKEFEAALRQPPLRAKARRWWRFW